MRELAQKSWLGTFLACLNWVGHCGTFDNWTKTDDVVWIYRAGCLKKESCVATGVPLSPVSQWFPANTDKAKSSEHLASSLCKFMFSLSLVCKKQKVHKHWWKSTVSVMIIREFLLTWISFSGLWVLSMSAYVKLLTKQPSISFLECNLLWDFLEISWLLSPFSLP